MAMMAMAFRAASVRDYSNFHVALSVLWLLHPCVQASLKRSMASAAWLFHYNSRVEGKAWCTFSDASAVCDCRLVIPILVVPL